MGSATSSPAPDLAVTSVRIEQDRLDAFKLVAAAHRRSVSAELRWLIDRAIAEHEAGIS
jgi:plasmid stability protein